MKCPHCGIEFHDGWAVFGVTQSDLDHQGYEFSRCTCPACKRAVIQIKIVTRTGPDRRKMVYPEGTMRPIPKEVTSPYADDFAEAVNVLSISPKASAALSRRNLQAMLRDVVKVKHAGLSKEIAQFIAMPSTPTPLAEVVDAVRNVGNLAAHPMKDTATGILVDVEPGEAEWLLDVLEAMFDYCFVQPARNAARTAALNAKLASAGKPPMKK